MKSMSIANEIEPRSGPPGGTNDVVVTAFISLFGFGLIFLTFKIPPFCTQICLNFMFTLFATLFDVV